MAAELIGRCRCPLCRTDKARLSLAKTGLPVLTCNACNLQVFARSDRSDELLRALLVPAEAKPEPAPAPAPTPQPKPAPAPLTPEQSTAIGQAQAQANQPISKPAPSIGWGLLR